MSLSLNQLKMAQQIASLEKRGGGGEASDIDYNPTASHLEATNVQDAIDELSGEISGLSADDVSYDGTDSGLSSVTVQSAIDETVNKIDTLTANDVDYGTGTVKDGLDKALSTLDYVHLESITTLPYTATKDGVAFLIVGDGSNSGGREFTVNGTLVAYITVSPTSPKNGMTIPLSTNDELSSNAGVFGTYNFVPYA